MTWAPFVLALVLGFAISAGIYAAYVWPDVEPEPEPQPEPEPPKPDPT